MYGEDVSNDPRSLLRQLRHLNYFESIWNPFIRSQEEVRQLHDRVLHDRVLRSLQCAATSAVILSGCEQNPMSRTADYLSPVTHVAGIPLPWTCPEGVAPLEA